MWSDDVATLLASLTIDETAGGEQAAINVEVPPQWTSLSGGRMPSAWMMELTVTIDGASHRVHLIQVPDAPIGVLLSGESNPTPTDHDGQTWWTTSAVTTPGINSLIGATELGAFLVTSDLGSTQLQDMMESFRPALTDGVEATIVASTAPGAVTVGTAPAAICGSSDSWLALSVNPPGEGAASGTVPTSLPLEGSPVDVTGYVIGDSIDASRVDESVGVDGSVDLSKVPMWAAVAADGVIIGYQKNVFSFGWTDNGTQRPPTNDASLIFDESGTRVIGRFIDGRPTLDPAI